MGGLRRILGQDLDDVVQWTELAFCGLLEDEKAFAGAVYMAEMVAGG
jgi:hypothetical protein